MGRSRAESAGTVSHGAPPKERDERAEPEVPPPGEARAQDEIAQRAYELYLERGCHDGHDVEDWLRAETELLQDRGRAAS